MHARHTKHKHVLRSRSVNLTPRTMHALHTKRTRASRGSSETVANKPRNSHMHPAGRRRAWLLLFPRPRDAARITVTAQEVHYKSRSNMFCSGVSHKRHVAAMSSYTENAAANTLLFRSILTIYMRAYVSVSMACRRVYSHRIAILLPATHARIISLVRACIQTVGIRLLGGNAIEVCPAAVSMPHSTAYRSMHSSLRRHVVVYSDFTDYIISCVYPTTTCPQHVMAHPHAYSAISDGVVHNYTRKYVFLYRTLFVHMSRVYMTYFSAATMYCAKYIQQNTCSNAPRGICRY